MEDPGVLAASTPRRHADSAPSSAIAHQCRTSNPPRRPAREHLMRSRPGPDPETKTVPTGTSASSWQRSARQRRRHGGRVRCIFCHLDEVPDHGDDVVTDTSPGSRRRRRCGVHHRPVRRAGGPSDDAACASAVEQVHRHTIPGWGEGEPVGRAVFREGIVTRAAMHDFTDQCQLCDSLPGGCRAGSVADVVPV